MIDTGDTAFMLLPSALVLLMTPGLALFYGGLCRGKNAASTVIYSVAARGVGGVVGATPTRRSLFLRRAFLPRGE